MSSKPELTIEDALRNAERSLNRSHLRPARGAESILFLLKSALDRVAALEAKLDPPSEPAPAPAPAPVDDVVPVPDPDLSPPAAEPEAGMTDLLGGVATLDPVEKSETWTPEYPGEKPVRTRSPRQSRSRKKKT